MNIFHNERYYRYLFDLQRRGITNMLGAAPYLVARFGLDKETARAILLEWCDECEAIAKELGIDF